jgi:nitroreductase
MSNITQEAVIGALEWRYAVKQFDPVRRIPDATWAALERSVVLTPTSFGLQLYRAVVVTDPALKAALPQHAWNQTQPRDCSHLLVLAAKQTVTADDIDHYLARVTEVSGAPKEALAGYRGMMTGALLQGPAVAQIAHWTAKQVYIAAGFFMETAALLGVDTCPMEGFAPAAVDKTLGLEGTGYTATVLLPAGYRASDDKYALRKKVRLPESELIIRR